MAVIRTIADALEESAKGPRRATGDTGSIEQHPLPDLIAAAKFVSSQTATRKRRASLRYMKIVPAGTDD